MIRAIIITGTLLFSAFFTYGYGEIIKVPQNYTTIQEAVNSASPGDTILESPGDYLENSLIDKPVFLISESGSDLTNIEDPDISPSWGTAETMVILIDSPGPGKVSGFTIIGKDDTNGAGIKLDFSNWEISDCTILHNHFGVYSYAVNSDINNNRIRMNYLGVTRHNFTGRTPDAS